MGYCEDFVASMSKFREQTFERLQLALPRETAGTYGLSTSTGRVSMQGLREIWRRLKRTGERSMRGCQARVPNSSRISASLFLALPLAFLVRPSVVRWTSIIWLGAVGALFSLANWAILLMVVRRKSTSSMAPLMGGILVALAIAAVPDAQVRRWAGLALITDPWILAMVGSGIWSRVSRHAQR